MPLFSINAPNVILILSPEESIDWSAKGDLTVAW